MVGKASMLQMLNLLLESYFKFFCTSDTRNLFLLILFSATDISYNKILLFVSMCINSSQDCLVTACSQSNWCLRMVLIGDKLFQNFSPLCNEFRILSQYAFHDSLVILFLSYYLSLLPKWTNKNMSENTVTQHLKSTADFLKIRYIKQS